MIRRRPMESIRRHSNPSSCSTKDTAFVQCVDGREPQIHELWSLDLYRIIRKVHPTARVEVISGNVRKFVTNYLAENGRIIQTIGQLSINDSVQFWGVLVQSWVRGFPFLSNLKAPAEDTVWVSGHSNKNWGGRKLEANSITNDAWGASVDPRPDYLPRSLVNSCAATHCVSDDFLCQRY